jgi:hypothetical protein
LADILSSFLLLFLTDPLIEWTSTKRSAQNDLGESEAVRIVGDIEKALQGKTDDALLVSVEGQV